MTEITLDSRYAHFVDQFQQGPLPHRYPCVNSPRSLPEICAEWRNRSLCYTKTYLTVVKTKELTILSTLRFFFIDHLTKCLKKLWVFVIDPFDVFQNLLSLQEIFALLLLHFLFMLILSLSHSRKINSLSAKERRFLFTQYERLTQSRLNHHGDWNGRGRTDCRHGNRW